MAPLTPVPLDSHPQPYEELRYKLSLEFPSGYPYTAPTVRFLTPCYHPNVDTQGNICLDILKEKWSALYDVRTILLSVQSLLAGGSRRQTAVECWGKRWWWWGSLTQIRAQGCPGHPTS